MTTTKQLKICKFEGCGAATERLKRGLCNKCYERVRNAGLLDQIADAPIPNGAWLVGRGSRSQVLATTPPHPVTEKAGTYTGRPLNTPRELGTRLQDPSGYIRIKTESGFRLEHRVVMEKKIGRPLISGKEIVHHRNGDRADNRPDNLELWTGIHPYGARVSDVVDYLVDFHLEAVLAAIDGRVNVYAA